MECMQQQHVSCSTLVPWSKSPSLYVESRADLKYAGNRAATFLFYPPSMVSTSSLIDAGLYYTGEEDICRCYECKIEMKQLKIGDSPTSIHQFMSPECPYILSIKDDLNTAQCLSTLYISTRVRKPKLTPSIGNILYFELYNLQISWILTYTSLYYIMLYHEQKQNEPSVNIYISCFITDKAALRKENARLRASISCCRCGARVQTLFLPCRHVNMCEECSINVDDCLKCGKKILGTVRVYLI